MLGDACHVKLFSVLLWVMIGSPVSASETNLARSAHVTASTYRPEYPPANVNDGDMGTQWGTAEGATAGQWLELEWSKPLVVASVVLHSTGPWTKKVEVQALRGTTWNTIATRTEPQTLRSTIWFSFMPEETRAIRFLFEGGAAFYECEVFDNTAIADALSKEALPRIDVAGDLRGHLVGVFSSEMGSVGIAGAAISASGEGPHGHWTSTAETNPEGLFQVEVPYGAMGLIRLSASKGQTSANLDEDARDVSWTLTPIHGQDRVSLNGQWGWKEVAPDNSGKRWQQSQSGWSTINVPAHWEMEGHVAESGFAVYRKQFFVPGNWRGKRIKVRADAIYSSCRVLVNGHYVGSHDGGATPREFDISDVAKVGEDNEIQIVVEARSNAGNLDNASYFAYFELAGIWQPIQVFAVDKVHISHVDVETPYNPAFTHAWLDVNLDLVAEGKSASSPYKVDLKLLDPRGRPVPVTNFAQNVTINSWSKQKLSFHVEIPHPEGWNAESPRLYKLLGYVDGREVFSQAVGFRQLDIKDRAVTLNGVPLKIRGISKLEAHPLMGRALTPDVTRLDTEMIKSANFNAVRATIFPPHPDALDDADVLGLYFENEGPTCWGDHANDLRYLPLYIGVMCEYLERDRNHPCVIDWSICNESDFGKVFSLTYEYMRQIDPTRLYTATFETGYMPITTFHHPVTVDRILESLSLPRPAFFDEVLGTFHGWSDQAIWLDRDPGMTDYWAEGIPEILDAINAGHNQLGTMEFSWSDDTFLVPGKGIDIWRHEQPPIRYGDSIYKLPKRGIVGDVLWGIVDGWRRPRPEYWLSKKLYSPIKIKEEPVVVPTSGPIRLAVKNFNQFVNLDRYRCNWTVGSEKGEARAACAPMSAGWLDITTRARPKSDDILSLRFVDETGRLVDSYELRFKAHELPRFDRSQTPAIIREQRAYLDGATAVRLIGKDCEVAYDRTSRAMLRALKGSEVVMTSGPTLRLMNSKAPADNYPIGFGLGNGQMYDNAGTVWRLTSVSYRTEGSQAVLDWTGSYGDDLVGGYQMRMDDAGDLEIRYRFTYKGAAITVREIGLEFALPLACSRLEWDRRAEYSDYPPDHIGRPVGIAVPHPAVPQLIPPGRRPYGLDDHPLGCNDFRSTKRNIYWASLTDRLGEGIKVISDGTQHVRATLGTHDIFLRVMDFYGGEGYTYHEGYHYGEGRKIKTGDVLKGTVRIQLLAGESER